MNKKIVTLTGFMGCGKTHVSKILAEELGFDVIDSDKEIEKVKKKTIPQIMAEVGEFGFRKIESEVIKDILDGFFIVLSAGGGAILKNSEILLEKSTVVFLDTDFEVCYQRIKNDLNRPLVQGKTKAQIAQMYVNRYDVYKNNCHFSVRCDDAFETVKKIKDFLQNS